MKDEKLSDAASASSQQQQEGAREFKGFVIKNIGNTYVVRDAHGSDFRSNAKGKFRLEGIRSTSPIVVGDKVFVEIQPDGTAYITEIAERKNYIIRRASNLSKYSHILAANIDLALLCVTVRFPETTTTFIDRFLVTAEAYSIPTCLVFNKMDLYDQEDMAYLNGMVLLYEHIGYPCLKTSTETRQGMDKIRALTENKITLLAGHSGVGKSSIINLLTERESQKVGEISRSHLKGMHTTTFSEMIELNNGGFIIDTPGIKGFGTIDMSEDEISHYFPEIFNLSKDCRYANCRHINEPDCAVLNALEKYHISQSRYQSYLNILEDSEAQNKYR